MIKPVSGACNMRCRYCFYADVMAHRQTKTYPRMTLETLETIVRRAFRYADGAVSFAFQGGEPTLIGLPYFQALVRFVREYNIRRQPVRYAVQTNGYDLPDEMIEFFARERFLIGVSLDGVEETHDRTRISASGEPTFQTVLETTRRLAAHGVDFNILCVVNAYVAREPRRVFEALAPYGYIQFIACLDGFDEAHTEHSLDAESYLEFLKVTFDLYHAAHKRGKPVSIRNFDNYIGILLGMPPENCAMGGRCAENYLIESDGSVYPCDFYVLDAWRLGNILETPFQRLGASALAKKFRADSERVPDACKQCRWYPYCKNGCKRERDPDTGLNKWCACNRRFFAYAHAGMLEIAEMIRRREEQALRGKR